ncbi:MAG: aminotransferase class III-fold pyridoxal phosphate-dependent enzyme, partial [Candidatus Hadarchaeales archaeon]
WIFIADEVQTGLGRSGKMFAMEHWNVEPDIVCIAKALAGGIAPIGATVAREEIMDWEPGAHASTFGGNLVACVAAIEGIKILKEEKLVERAAKLGEEIMKRLQEIAETSKLIGDVRGKGLMIGVELVKDKKTKNPATNEREALIRKALDKGLILFRGGQSTIRIAPPLVIPKRDLEIGMDIFEQSLREVEKEC